MSYNRTAYKTYYVHRLPNEKKHIKSYIKKLGRLERYFHLICVHLHGKAEDTYAWAEVLASELGVKSNSVRYAFRKLEEIGLVSRPRCVVRGGKVGIMNSYAKLTLEGKAAAKMLYGLDSV